MQIRLEPDGELLELFVDGVLDNDSSAHFRSTIDEVIHEGWHRILVHLDKVTYMSSAGITALLAAHAQLDKLNGLFGVCNLSKPVERVLGQTKLLDKLQCDPEVARAGSQSGTMTRLSQTRVASEDGIDFQVYDLNVQDGFRCTLYGDSQPVFDACYQSADCHQVAFPDSSIGLGLGGFGEDFASAQPCFGEFLSVAGAVAQSPALNRGLPDYQITQEDFTPNIQMLYGVKCNGRFAHLIRFGPSDQSQPVAVSRLVDQALKLAECNAAAVVILAECAGLVGTRLKTSPAQSVAAGAANGKRGSQRFDFPEIRDWLSFSAEQLHRRSLVAIVGVVHRQAQDNILSDAKSFLRPINADLSLSGHFHAAAFPYRPLKKRTLDLQTSVRDLFETGEIQDVLHLLRDDRPVTGAGESELVSGGCWISPITSVKRVES